MIHSLNCHCLRDLRIIKCNCITKISNHKYITKDDIKLLYLETSYKFNSDTLLDYNVLKILNILIYNYRLEYLYKHSNNINDDYLKSIINDVDYIQYLNNNHLLDYLLYVNLDIVQKYYIPILLTSDYLCLHPKLYNYINKIIDECVVNWFKIIKTTISQDILDLILDNIYTMFDIKIDLRIKEFHSSNINTTISKIYRILSDSYLMKSSIMDIINIFKPHSSYQILSNT